MILAQLHGVTVQVTRAYSSNGRKRAFVVALSGEPFTRQSHGGPVNLDWAIVNADQLSDVQQVPDDEQPKRRSRLPGFRMPDWLTAAEGSFPDCFRREQKHSLGGINND